MAWVRAIWYDAYLSVKTKMDIFKVIKYCVVLREFGTVVRNPGILGTQYLYCHARSLALGSAEPD